MAEGSLHGDNVHMMESGVLPVLRSGLPRGGHLASTSRMLVKTQPKRCKTCFTDILVGVIAACANGQRRQVTRMRSSTVGVWVRVSLRVSPETTHGMFETLDHHDRPPRSVSVLQKKTSDWSLNSTSVTSQSPVPSGGHVSERRRTNCTCSDRGLQSGELTPDLKCDQPARGPKYEGPSALPSAAIRARQSGMFGSGRLDKH